MLSISMPTWFCSSSSVYHYILQCDVILLVTDMSHSMRGGPRCALRYILLARFQMRFACVAKAIGTKRFVPKRPWVRSGRGHELGTYVGSRASDQAQWGWTPLHP